MFTTEPRMNSAQLPIRHNLALSNTLSLVIILLMAGFSLLGLLSTNRVYPTDELRNSFIANDVVNLLIGLPVLLGSLWLTRSNRLVGLLLWPGALLYVLYNYIAYTIGIPFSMVSLGYLALVFLSAYNIYDLLHRIDGNSLKGQLAGVVPVKLAGWVLVVFGVAFILRAAGVLFQAGMDQTSLPLAEIGVLIADLVLSAAWLAGGILLLRRLSLGYVSGLGLLFAGSMLFAGLVIFLLLSPLLTEAPFAPVDVIVVSIMGLVCSIPFVIYLRAVISRGSYTWEK